MDTPFLFRVISLGSEQGRPREPAAPTYVLAFAAYDGWMALGSRHNVPPTSVMLKRQPPDTNPADVPGDLYELPHHGRASDLRLVRPMPKPKPAPKAKRRR